MVRDIALIGHGVPAGCAAARPLQQEISNENLQVGLARRR
jgi:hypothetical protein